MVKINSKSNQSTKGLTEVAPLNQKATYFKALVFTDILRALGEELATIPIKRRVLRSLVTLGINLNHHFTGKSRLILKFQFVPRSQRYYLRDSKYSEHDFAQKTNKIYHVYKRQIVYNFTLSKIFIAQSSFLSTISLS